MSSRYKRKSNRGLSRLDHDALVNALKAVKVGTQALRAAAKTFNIPRTSLQRYIKSFEATGKDMATMSNQEIKDFIGTLTTYGTNQLVRWG